MNHNISKHIKTQLEQQPLKLFTAQNFSGIGSRAAIDQALYRLVRAGSVKRVARGVYTKPSNNPHLGNVLPGASAVVEHLAKTQGLIVQPDGASAANGFGFSTQVPTQPVYLTNGTSRVLHLGKLEVRLKHVSPRRLLLAGRPAGAALSALYHLGRHGVTKSVIAQLRGQLELTEFAALEALGQEASSAMPSWMRQALKAGV